SAVGTLALFGVAAMLLVCGVRPFGKNAPPPEVCFGVGGGLAVFGFGLLYAGYHFAVRGRQRGRSYHLFRDGLAVAGPAGDVRQIAWGQIGPEKWTGRRKTGHAFPVEAEDDLAFDAACADHAALAAAIAERAARARWARLTPAAWGARPTIGAPAPAFLVHDPAENGLYRVSPLAGHLLFVRVGDGSAAGTRGVPGRAVAVHGGGLAGAAAGWMQMKQIERLQQALDALDGADEPRLLELAYGLKGSRLIAPAELSAVRFARPTVWEKMSKGMGMVAVLRFTHAAWGEKALYFEAPQHLADAARMIGALLKWDVTGQLADVTALV
ncbi:MAG TPA: hypothetical protein VGF55_27040, partial [Gemmataceae bacterium]